MAERKDYKERYKRIGESEWFKTHYHGKSVGAEEEPDCPFGWPEWPKEKPEDTDPQTTSDMMKNYGAIKAAMAEEKWALAEAEIHRLTKEPRYTKVEIENMLYRIIDDHNLWADDEDKGAAFKLLNAFLKEWK